MVKKSISFILSSIFLFIFTAPAHAAFEVQNFDSRIEINENGSAIVHETIVVNFLEKSIGIYRDIPLRYRWKGHNFNLNIQVEGVTDENGNPRDYKLERQNKNLIVWLGNPQKPVTDTQTYKITYKMVGAIHFTSTQDKFYWHPIGNGWKFPVQKAYYELTLPEKTVGIKAWGAFYKGHNWRTTEINAIKILSNKVMLESTQPFKPYEAWMTTVSWEKGNIQRPSSGQILIERINDNSFVIILIVFIILTSSFLLYKLKASGQRRR